MTSMVNKERKEKGGAPQAGSPSTPFVDSLPWSVRVYEGGKKSAERSTKYSRTTVMDSQAGPVSTRSPAWM